MSNNLHRQPYGWRMRYAELALEMALLAEQERQPKETTEMYLRIAVKLEEENHGERGQADHLPH